LDFIKGGNFSNLLATLSFSSSARLFHGVSYWLILLDRPTYLTSSGRCSWFMLSLERKSVSVT
jgi:hypothetical protein